MRVYTPPPLRVSSVKTFSVAIEHCQAVFRFDDACVCTALMLWTALIWAASRTSSLSHAVERLYPDVQDQTFWNLLRSNLSQQVPALERRLNELLRLPVLRPQLKGRRLDVAVDYHLIPYYGAPKKVTGNCIVASPNAAPRDFMPMPRSAWSRRVGVLHWR